MNTRTTSGWSRTTAATFAFALIATLALAGCGGSGGGAPPEEVPTPGVTGLGGTASAFSGAALDEYVMITLTPLGGTTAFAAQADGTYGATVAAGDYTLGATRPGYEDYTSGTLTVIAEQVLVHNFAMTPLLAGAYIGTQACGTCHTAQLDKHLQSGHPYKINKVVGGVAPIYPFTDISAAFALIGDEDGVTDNTLGTPATWNDLTYVIGGYNWKARFIDADGYIVTGSMVQYNLVIPGGNLTTPTITSYHDDEVDKPFNCGNCHTTGWKHVDPIDNPVGQDGLPGMHGTFTEGGIRCEACHGAGSTHAQTTLATDITKLATPRTPADFAAPNYGYGAPIACGECHTRDGERDYPTFLSGAENAGWHGDANWPDMGGRIAASGGLVKHHEQGDEVLGLHPNETSLGVYGTPLATRSAAYADATYRWTNPPQTVGGHANCRNCHGDSHASTVNRDNPAYTGPAGVDSSNAGCLKCHSDTTYAPANAFRGSMSGLNCVDCHMPKTAKSATSLVLANGVIRGDVTSHIFGIDLSGAPAFTLDGKFRNPYLTLEQSCLQCHGSGEPGGTFSFGLNVPGDWNGFHTNQGALLRK